MATLEERVTRLEVRVEKEAELAASRDEDLRAVQATQRSHTKMLQALQEGQVGHLKRLDGIDQRLDGVDQRLDRVDQRLDRVDQRLDRLEQLTATGFAVIGAQLQVLLDRG